MNEFRTTPTLASTRRALTVGEWGAEWLRRREAEGSRSGPTEKSRWKYVEQSWLGRLHIADVSPHDARRWLDEFRSRGLSLHTQRDVLNQVRQTFDGARELGKIETNPFAFIRLPRWKPNQPKVPEAWTVLQPREQALLLSVIPERERNLVAFAMGTGLRQGECWALRRKHVVLSPTPHVTVVFGGTDDRPTKSGTPRTVPLFGMALKAMQHELSLLPVADDRDAYMWPAVRGGPRDKKPPARWKAWLAEAGITRRVRWHDLRHTCAASLVSGWWGRSWSLEEVKELLGHSSITITERYAHFARSVLMSAAIETAAAIGRMSA